jgi:hypothetical protein
MANDALTEDQSVYHGKPMNWLPPKARGAALLFTAPFGASVAANDSYPTAQNLRGVS